MQFETNRGVIISVQREAHQNSSGFMSKVGTLRAWVGRAYAGWLNYSYIPADIVPRAFPRHELSYMKHVAGWNVSLNHSDIDTAKLILSVQDYGRYQRLNQGQGVTEDVAREVLRDACTRYSARYHEMLERHVDRPDLDEVVVFDEFQDQGIEIALCAIAAADLATKGFDLYYGRPNICERWRNLEFEIKTHLGFITTSDHGGRESRRKLDVRSLRLKEFSSKKTTWSAAVCAGPPASEIPVLTRKATGMGR